MLTPKHTIATPEQVWPSTGSLWYVVEEGEWELKHAKPGDVGFDLPVIVNAKNPAHMPRVLEAGASQPQPLRPYYIAPQGSAEDPIPYIDIPPGGSVEISTGLRIKIPDDAWVSVRPRSSTGWKKRLNVFEGTIDSGYTGPLFALVFNPQHIPVRVHEGDRLAQLVVVPKYPLLAIVRASELPTTNRGSSGFGSSGGQS